MAAAPKKAKPHKKSQECKLMGSAAQEYREKVWVPQVRNNCNNVQAASSLQFPKDLVHYGLTETLLETVFTEVECHEGSLSWHLRGVPCVGFYKDLHPYLKKWPRSVSATKSLIGRFYIAIDKSLQVKGCRSEIAYQFIERISISDQLRDSVMKYGYEENEVIVLSHQMEQFCDEIKKLTFCYEAMKEESEKTKCELSYTLQALRDVQRELQVLKHEWDYVGKKVDMFKRVDDADLKESTTEEKGHQLSSALECLQQELSI